MPTIHTHLAIDASAQAVWAVLADLPSWSRWNPGVAGVQGELALGSELRLTLSLGGRAVPLPVRVSELVPGGALAWRGGVRRVGWAEHRFAVEPLGPDRCRFDHSETFGGLLPRLAWPGIRRVLGPRYEATNRALAAEVARQAEDSA